MKTAFMIVLAILTVLSLDLNYQQDKRIQELDKSARDVISSLSTSECFAGGEPTQDCYDTQYNENLHFYLIKDRSRGGGPPGVPGPKGLKFTGPSGPDSTTIPPGK